MSTTKSKTIGDLIKEAMHAQGITSELQLSAASGVPTTTIHMVVKGQRRISWDNLQRLAIALCKPTDYFRDIS